MDFFKWLASIFLVLIIIYFFGPQPAKPVYNNDLPTVPAELVLLEKYIHHNEARHKLKPDNEARIIWLNDSVKEKTDFAVVYLHGFSASQEEGDPVHIQFAKKMGCNLYLSRLAEHGIDTIDAMINLTADKLWNSAKEAYAIGKQLGKKVILLGTSTGGTLALKLAAEYADIAGLILLSPNIAINDPLAWVANNHWGLQIARLVKGKYNITDDTMAIEKKYWYNKYRMESVTEMQELLETTMKASLFKNIKQPVLLLYYYKDVQHQDKTVKVSAMKKMFRQLGTADSLKREVAVPNAGEHVIGSYIKSKDVQTVSFECEKFGNETLHITAAQ
ncbi:MAG: alpha/beta hydrolase [Chitinophagaceae bacterium]